MWVYEDIHEITICGTLLARLLGYHIVSSNNIYTPYICYIYLNLPPPSHISPRPPPPSPTRINNIQSTIIIFITFNMSMYCTPVEPTEVQGSI